MTVWPVICFGWKPPLLIPDHLTSDLPAPRCHVKKAPYSLVHGHGGVVWWAARGITPLAGSQGRTRDPPRGKPVTYPLGHGAVWAFFRIVFKIVSYSTGIYREFIVYWSIVYVKYWLSVINIHVVMWGNTNVKTNEIISYKSTMICSCAVHILMTHVICTRNGFIQVCHITRLLQGNKNCEQWKFRNNTRLENN